MRSRCKEHSSCSLLRKTQQVSWSLGFPLATSSRLVCIKWDQPQTKVRGKHREPEPGREGAGQGRRCFSVFETRRQAHLGAGWDEPQ